MKMSLLFYNVLPLLIDIYLSIYPVIPCSDKHESVVDAAPAAQQDRAEPERAAESAAGGGGRAAATSRPAAQGDTGHRHGMMNMYLQYTCICMCIYEIYLVYDGYMYVFMYVYVVGV
jgi:hypothetical protein